MYFNRVVVTITILIMLCAPISICALTNEVVQVETVTERNPLEELYYRLVLKDTKDFYDYVIFGILCVGLVIIMIFQNTHYYTVTVNKDKKQKHYQKQYNKSYKYEKQNSYHKRKNYNKKKNIVENKASE